jgi:formiminoglutamase
LVPLTDFDGDDIWFVTPESSEQVARRDTFHKPYHAALMAELNRVRDIHGVAILYDCHSIRSEIPFLFDGILPDFNIGTNNGVTCSDVITNVVADICQGSIGYSTVINGRFKGGWTTRHYGRPEDGIHAIQMELAQSTYMEEVAPWTWDTAKATKLRKTLAKILKQLDLLVRDGALK